MATDTVLVSNVSGKAWMRASDGTLIALHEGMRIPVDAHVITDSGAQVTLMADGVPPIIVGEGRDLVLAPDMIQPPESDANTVTPPADPAVAEVLAALESGQDIFDVLDPTAAVLSGGQPGDGSNFVRLISIIETTTPLSLEYPNGAPEPIEDVILSGDGIPGSELAAPTLTILDYNNDTDITAGTFTIREDQTPPPGDDLPPSNGDNIQPHTLLLQTQDAGDTANHEPALGQFRFTADGLQNVTFTVEHEMETPVGG